MKLEIPYSEAKKRYPQHVKEIMKSLKNGKSKEKERNEEELTWAFSWGVQIKAFSFADIIAGAGEEEKTPEEELEETINNIVGLNLTASIGRWTGSSDSYIEEVPNEIIEIYKKSHLPQPIPAHLLSLPRLKVDNDKEISEHPILLGYKDKKEDTIKLLVDSEGVEILYTIHEDYALWSGALHKSFDTKLKAASSGDIVKFRSKPFIKLSDEEIENLSKKIYEIGIGF